MGLRRRGGLLWVVDLLRSIARIKRKFEMGLMVWASFGPKFGMILVQILKIKKLRKNKLTKELNKYKNIIYAIM